MSSLRLIGMLLRQPWHAWRRLDAWTQLQWIFMIGLIILYIGHLIDGYLQASPQPQRLKISLILFHLAVYYLLVSGVYAFFLILPTRDFSHFNTLPLSAGQVGGLLWFRVQVFWLPVELLLLLYLTVLALSDLFFAIVLMVYLVIYQAVIFCLLLLTYRLRRKFLPLTAWSIAIFVLLASAMQPGLMGLFFSALLLMILAIALWQSKRREEWHLEWIFTAQKPTFTSKSRVVRDRGQWPKVSKPLLLLLRENFLRWRHAGYRMRKWLILFLYMLLCALLVFSRGQNSVEYLTLISVLLVWWHYGHYFSPYYQQPEPEWFIRLLPIPFAGFLMGRLLTEIPFMFIILILFSIVLHAAGIPLVEHYQLLLFLLSVFVTILLTTIGYQLLFYDNPRLAGYAYHLTLLLFAVLIHQDYLVGPFMMLTFFLFIFYRGYRLLKG